MAGGSTGRKAGKPRPRPPPKARRPVLGNDPFERGAAPREPVAAPAGAVPPAVDAAAAEPRALAATRRDASVPAGAAVPAATAPSASVPAAAAPAAARTAVPPAAALPAPVVPEPRGDGAPHGLEARLHDLAVRAGLAGAEDELREALRRLLPAVRARLQGALDLVRLAEPPERLDAYGMDARFAERLAPLVELLYSTWWRVEVRGIERVPSEGGAVVVANHAGLVPWDAFVLRHALRRDHPARRELRPLLDDRECALPVVGAAAIRAGAVRAGPDAAEALLRRGDLVGVFPEGSQGARKPWRDRYQVLRFGRGGFVKVALRAGVPIVPCAIVGSEEASPGISRPGWLAERLGVPLLASNHALRIASAGLVPLPSKWTLRFGEPVDARAPGAGAAADPAAVSDLAARVRATLQAMLDEGVAARSSVYL